MKGIGRNLRFWGETMQKMMLYMVLTVIGMLAFMTVMDGGDFVEEFGKDLPTFLIMITFLTVFMNALNGMSTYFPVTVSLGSTRKQSYMAMQITQHGIMAELVILIYLCYNFITPEMYRGFLAPYPVTFVGLILLVLGLGDLISASCLRFGRTIGVIVYMVTIIIVVGGVVGIGMSGVLDLMVVGSSLQAILASPWIFLLGLLVDLIMMSVLYLQVRKSNLQFA